MSAAPSYRVGVVGATGAVGSTVLEVLAERGFPARGGPVRLRALGRAEASFAGGEIECRTLTDESIQGLDLVISSAGGKVSAEWAPRLVDAGAVVVDNTSYWRMHDDVPLVIAEVNPEALDAHRGLIANPNCSTMQMVVALKPIWDSAGIERLVISTYQSVSGTGQSAVEELRAQIARRPRRRDRPRTRGLSASDRLQHLASGRDASSTATTTRPRSAS